MPENTQSRHAQALDALERLGNIALRDQSMESVLRTVTDLAKEVLPGSPEVSITLLANDKATTAVSTGQLAMDLDESQYGRGYGPCLHAASTGELTEISDASTDPRWPEYAEVARERGSGSSLSVPLRIQEGLSGALNVYARETDAFDDEARQAAQKFAPYAAVAVANMHAYETARNMADNLQVALESRAVIDQAKGILMERHKLTADQAFQAMAAVSMRANRKLRDIAEQLVRTGEFQLDRPS
ncbi:GAF and ANTAR domain-containing protein [Modestobacter sp. VKM Ac-2986]|uniref:GAF and ANTAR domain-containing protein n=1 Tax=Modestobacter sp. VKM Ac-2986 TaxID=3004140 RepID=UPI0022AB0D34|nr:GAF and ANTAR domain-containing protein [Modestobacter sp. VKM Ac-2986]MCZ2828646.1 GAF and ANTAR domain-containing protein [Modestobacter sp. VKM Ac-2986]